MSRSQRNYLGSAARLADRAGLRRSIAIAIVGLLCATLVAWISLPIPLSAMNPVLAAKIAPPTGTVTASRAAVMLLMPTAKPAELEGLARDALTSEPMEFDTASSLGLVYFVKGERERALKLFNLIGGANLRDKNSHAMLLQSALDRNDGAGAVREAEIVLRQRRSLESTALKVLTLMVDRGMVTSALADRLTSGAPWRGQLMRHIGGNGESPKHELELFRAMKARGAGPTGSEMDLWLLRQAGTRPASEVADLWREFDTAPLDKRDRLLRAGGMDTSSVPRPFNWNFYSSEDGYAERDAAPDRKGQAMFVEFRGASSMALARQWMILDPGRYRLTASALAPFAIKDSHVSLRVYCADGGKPLATITSKVGQADKWQTLAADFTVPSGCSVQSLDVSGEGIPDAGYEQMYFDDFAVSQIGADMAPRER